jgi:hypothetical protein
MRARANPGSRPFKIKAILVFKVKNKRCGGEFTRVVRWLESISADLLLSRPMLLAHLLTILDSFKEKDYTETSLQLNASFPSIKSQISNAQSEIRAALQNRLTPMTLDYRISLN